MSNVTPKPAVKVLKPKKPKTGQLNVRIPEELIRRLNAVIGARGKYKSQSDFVAAILDARLKSYQSHVEDIRSQESELDPD
jgi:Arc/MetJ-type ribon-helix-helix transcriptional regulator